MSHDGLHPRPTGWYAIASAAELKRGQLLRIEAFDDTFALARGDSGVAFAVHRTCPHLGADLSAGRVCGDHIVCPFHAFEFDREGRCASTPYGARPPKAAVPTLPIREQNGLILAWWDELGRAPEWAPPILDDDGWTPPAVRRFELTAHPFDTTENSVDVGHFSTVHGFTGVGSTSPLAITGPRLQAGYEFEHPYGPLRLYNRFDVDVWGLGYSLVTVTTPRFGLTTRLWVLSTPQANGRISLRLAASANTHGVARLGQPWLTRLFGEVVRWAAAHQLAQDARADFDIWARREHVARPKLATGDGPIAQYRAWARQFDPPATAHATTSRPHDAVTADRDRVAARVHLPTLSAVEQGRHIGADAASS